MTAMKRIRQSRNLTQKEVAERLPISKGHYKHVESGRRMPSITVSIAIAELFRCTVDDLAFWDVRNRIDARRKLEKSYVDKRRASQPWARALDVAYCDLPARARKCGVHLLAKPDALIGCSREQFKIHIESQFREGMTWIGFGSLWQMDHRKPIRDHDLSTVSGQLKAFGFRNIQVLTISEHEAKTTREMIAYHQ